MAATRHQVCTYPCLDTPNRDAVRLWTALGPRLCRVAATRHQVCAVSVRNSAALGFGGSEAQGIVSRRGRGEGRTGSSGTRPLPAAMGSANRDAALSCRHYFWQNRGHWACAHTESITFGRTEGTWRVPMQSLLLLAELKALGVYPCGVYYFWQNWRHWACAHAEFITFGKTEDIGHVPMQNLLLLAELKALGVCPCSIYYFWLNRRHWACAHAELTTFGRTGGIGRVPMQHLLLWQN